MLTYIFQNSKGLEIAQRTTDMSIGSKGFVELDGDNYRVSPSASTDKILICTPVNSNLVKFNPVTELVEFFNKIGFDDVTPETINEDGLKDAFFALVSPFFEIQKEVTGEYRSPDNTIHSLRIDAILTPKREKHLDVFGNYRNLSFGVELKSPKTIGKTPQQSLSGLLAQSTDYANCFYGSFGQVPVFALPVFNHRARVELLNYTANFHVGSITTHIQNDNAYYAFRLGEMAIWDSRNGFSELGLTHKFKRKYGNRS
ncbi:hypothetical protein [Fibrella aquatica]|uniref:hypothetical protein n=1 Tax=Fibrella aquatica TaxID=3242487 RepID=UPI00351F95B0